MKTVLFIDKGSDGVWPSYLTLSYLLEGWHRRGLFEVCSWRPAARSARAAVPALPGILGDEQDWQAVIVCDLRGEAPDIAADPHFDNPFDFPENYGRSTDEAVAESERAVVRLCQMLGGLPDKVHMEEAPSDELAADEGTQLTYPQSDTYYELSERYRTNLPRPLRIICVSPRGYDEDVYRARTRELASAGMEATADTAFWERNDYPASTRFVVFDWPMRPTLDEEAEDEARVVALEEHIDPIVEKRAEQMLWLSFWTGVTTLLTSELSSAELRPYRLYRIDPKVTPSGVRVSVSKRWSEWVAARDHIADQIAAEERRLKRAEYEEQELPETTTNILVRFDVSEDDLVTDPAYVGPLRDKPRSDMGVWAERHREVSSGLRALLRSPRRALGKAVHAFRAKSSLSEEVLEYCVLTDEQRLDLEDDLVAEEYVLAEGTGRRAFRLESHAESFDEQSQEVIDRIQERPFADERGFAFLALLAGMALGLFALVPSMAAVQEATRSTVGIAVAALVVPPVMIVAFLLSQQKAVRDAYEALNDWLRGVARTLEAEAERLGRRLSLYAQVRKEWSIVRRQENLDKPTRRGQWLGERMALITSRMGAVSAAVGEPAVDLEALARIRNVPWNDLSRLLDDETFFDAAPSTTFVRPLYAGASDANPIAVPFGFVDAVELEALRIH